jgi:segregation and condensation protein B
MQRWVEMVEPAGMPESSQQQTSPRGDVFPSDMSAAAPADELARAYGTVLERGGQTPGSSEEPEGPEKAIAGVAPDTPPPLYRIIEALLFVGGPPLTAARAADAVRGLTAEQLREAIDVLNRDYRHQGRPYRIQPRQQGFELTLLPRYRGILDSLYGSVREARLSPAAIDVLSLVAYRQPVTRQELESLRGADSASPLRQLVRLGLVALQRGDAGGREVAYGTTPRFLKLFNLTTLDDLPRTAELEKL